LKNLKHGVAYIVKIYGFNEGAVMGRPSIVAIPASSSGTYNLNRIDVSTFPWQLRVATLDANTLNLNWNEPSFTVRGN